MALHHQGLNNNQGAPDVSEQQNQEAYNRGFQNGERYEEAKMTGAPDVEGTSRLGATFDHLLNLVDDKPITEEVKRFVENVRDQTFLDTLKNVTDFQIEQCNAPKSVYILSARTCAGSRIGMLIGFTDLIGSEIPTQEVRSHVIELAKRNLANERPDIRPVGYRIYTRKDLTERLTQILRDITVQFVVFADPNIMSAGMGQLLSRNPNFRVSTANHAKIKAFKEYNSPHAVIPPMNAGLALDLCVGNQRDINGSIVDNDANYKTVAVVSAMVQFIERIGPDQQVPMNNQPRYAPYIRITDVDAIAPHPGLYLWAIIQFIAKFGWGTRWMNTFFQNNALAGNPSNLFTDPKNPNAMWNCKPEEAQTFWATTFNQFSSPIVTVDVAFGNRCIPLQYAFAAAADGGNSEGERQLQQEAISKVIKTCDNFFGPQADFSARMANYGNKITMPFSYSHTGVVSLGQHHYDSRSITFLTALAELAGKRPTNDAGMVLLRPNCFDNPTLTDGIMRTWLGDNAYTPMFGTKTVTFTQEFITACADALNASGIKIFDLDTQSHRAIFAGVNNVDNFSYQGPGVNIFQNNQFNTNSNYRPSWMNYAQF